MRTILALSLILTACGTESSPTATVAATTAVETAPVAVETKEATEKKVDEVMAEIGIENTKMEAATAECLPRVEYQTGNTVEPYYYAQDWSGGCVVDYNTRTTWYLVDGETQWKKHYEISYQTVSIAGKTLSCPQTSSTWVYSRDVSGETSIAGDAVYKDVTTYDTACKSISTVRTTY